MWQSFKNYYHLLQALIANFVYGFPSHDLTVIGVTGTDGKTTTSSLIYHILESSGKKAAIISTVAAIIDGKIYDTGFHVSTPGPFALQSYLKKAVNSGAKYMVLEVTSHALDQNRVYGIPFTIGVLTNVTHEHLDYHKTFEHYLKSKMKLLQASEIAVVNRDEEIYEKISNSKNQIAKRKMITFGLNKNAEVNPEVFGFKTHLPGEYNKYNILAAAAVSRELGIDDDDIRKAIMSFKSPVGRAEVVYNKDFTVMIDFAHTPNSLEQILRTVQKEKGDKGRLIHIFGAAGERDRDKRPKMGAVSAKFADIIVLTSEDPRSEIVEKIFEHIRSWIPEKPHKIVYEELDRQEAITRALSIAEKNDVVVITGKGHERSMNMGQGEMPWSEHEAVAKALMERNTKLQATNNK